MRENEEQSSQEMFQQEYSSSNKESIFNNDLEIIKRTKRFKTNDDYLLREIAGESVLVPVGDGAEQFNGMLTLNETFTYIWNQFNQAHTIGEVVLIAQEEFDDEGGQIEKDICRFVDEGLYYGLMKEEE